MGVFRKKREEDPAEEESKVRIKKDAKPIKDLNPENKKKRKEPKKPWGKGERILVFIVLMSTAGASAFLGLSSRGWKLPGYPRLAVPKVSWNKTYVFDESAQVGEVTELDVLPVVNEFREATNALTGVYGFYVVRLDSGEAYGYNDKQSFKADSLIELPVIVKAYRDLDLNDTYRLKAEDKVGTGTLSREDNDTVWTFGELVDLIINESDETAYNVVLNKLGKENAQSFLRTNGMGHTSLLEGKTSPQDMGKLLLKLWNGDYMNSGARDELLGLLVDTSDEKHLPAGIPDGVRVAHKYGREVNVVSDIGIVFGDEPFAVVIMSEGVKMTEADQVFPELARLIWEFEAREAVEN